MTDFRIRVIIDPGPAKAGAKQVEGQLKRTQGAADKLQGSLLRTFAGLGLAVGIAGSIRLLADFSQEMSNVRAITGATEQEFAALSEEAQRLGSTTRFTATQAAEGMAFLARAGFTAAESLEAVEGTLKLAQAGGLDLGQAADIASNALTGFRLEVGETARVVDVLAKAATSSNTTVGQLGEALKFVAPVAAGLGVDIETATASISALSDAGLQGSLAGTGLRRVLSELESPAAKTAQILGDLGLTTDQVKISQVGLIGALEALRDAGVDTGQALELFGDRGGPAFEVLSNAIPSIQNAERELRNAAGTADQIAEVMDDNLNGALLRVVSAFQGLILAAGESGAFTALTGTADALAVSLGFLTTNIDGVAAALTVLGVGLLLTKTAFVTNAVSAGAATLAYLQQTAAATALTFSLGGLTSVALGAAGALKAVALASIANPFVLVAAGAAAAFLAVKELTEGIEEYEKALKIADAGELGGLTEFGRAGAIIARTEKQIAAFQARIDAGDDNPQLAVQIENLTNKVEFYRGEQERIAGSTDKARAAAQKQREELEALNGAFERSSAALEDEARLLGLNTMEREVQARLLKEIQAIQKEGGPDLTNAQQEELESLIRRNQALQDQTDALDNIRGPQEEFVRQLTALQALQDQGKITLEEYNTAVQNLAQNAEGIDLSNITLPEGTEGVDLQGQLEQIREQIALEQERARVEAERAGIIRDLADPLQQLAERQALVNQLEAEGLITTTAAAAENARLTEEIKRLNPEYALQADILNEIKQPQEELAQRIMALDALYAQGRITLDEYTAAMDRLNQKNEEVGTSFGDGLTSGLQKIEKQVGTTASQVEGLMVNAFNQAADALTEFVTTGELDFKKFAQSIVQQITKIIIQELLLQAIRGISGGGSAPSGVTGNASGGPFEANQSMIVGEKGPELVNFGSPGVVTPANQTEQILSQQGGGETTVVQAPAPEVNVSVVNVDDPSAARDAMDTDDGAQVIMNQIRKNKTAIRRELQ